MLYLFGQAALRDLDRLLVTGLRVGQLAVHAAAREKLGIGEGVIPVGRILVTGATGSLGSNVIAEAARRGLEVRALVRDPARVHRANGVELVQGDALDPAAVTRAL
jgi:hypothetical protein